MMKIKLLAAITATALALPALAEIQVSAMDTRSPQGSQLTPKETAKLEKAPDKAAVKETKAKASPKGSRKVAKTQGKKAYKPKRDAQVGAPANQR
jgi:hypothetical protein